MELNYLSFFLSFFLSFSLFLSYTSLTFLFICMFPLSLSLSQWPTCQTFKHLLVRFCFKLLLTFISLSLSLSISTCSVCPIDLSIVWPSFCIISDCLSVKFANSAIHFVFVGWRPREENKERKLSVWTFLWRLLFNLIILILLWRQYLVYCYIRTKD